MSVSADTRNRLAIALANTVSGNEVADALDGITALPSGNIIVGSAGGVATDVTMSGDATIAASGAVTLAASSANVPLSTSASKGVGYATGAGGTVTQSTDKSTTVALAKMSGAITMNNAALNAGVIVSFTLTNAGVAATDVLVLNHISGGTVGSYGLNAQCAAGSATINVRNNTAGNLSEAVVIQFAVIKGVNA